MRRLATGSGDEDAYLGATRLDEIALLIPREEIMASFEIKGTLLNKNWQDPKTSIAQRSHNEDEYVYSHHSMHHTHVHG